MYARRSSRLPLLGGRALAALVCLGASTAFAANATRLDTDPNAEGLGFGRNDAFTFGAAYQQNVVGIQNGNEFLAQTQLGVGGGTGAGFSIPVSNGENGLNQSLDGATNMDINADVPNATAANSVFTTIGNASGKLENGNVIRFSTWVRTNPANPVTVAPQIEPVFKFEFWKEALSTNTDNDGRPQPFYGDKIFDTEQHGGVGVWIDLNNDGTAADGAAASAGRLKTISSASWTRIEVQHTVNDSTWIGIGDDVYTVAQVEEVRSVMFWGDFISTDFSADGADGGTLWFDNTLVEVFKNEAAVTPNTSPNPTLSEGAVLPGDYNDDGVVSGLDLVDWQRSFVLPNADADGDTDGDTDGNDFLIWQRNKTAAVSAAAGVAAPEPTGLAMGALACGLLAGCRRRSTK